MKKPFARLEVTGKYIVSDEMAYKKFFTETIMIKKASRNFTGTYTERLGYNQSNTEREEERKRLLKGTGY